MVRQNIKSLILLTIFSVSFSANLLPVKKDPTSLTKTTKSFYSEKKWDYLEKLFIKELRSVYSKTENIKNKVIGIAFFIPVVVFYYFDRGSSSMNDYLFLSSFLGGANSLFSAISLNWILKKTIKKEKILTMFELFFQKYNPEIDTDSDELNTKGVIPEELYKTFDLMYEDYSLNGKEGLKESYSDLFDFIIEKIKNDVKSEKYDRKWKKKNSRQKRRNERMRNVVNSSRK